MREAREEGDKEAEKFRNEIKVRDKIENKLQSEIVELKEEILLAKRILKDPNLCQTAMRRFHECVEKESDAKFLSEGGIVTEIIEQ